MIYYRARALSNTDTILTLIWNSYPVADISDTGFIKWYPDQSGQFNVTFIQKLLNLYEEWKYTEFSPSFKGYIQE